MNKLILSKCLLEGSSSSFSQPALEAIIADGYEPKFNFIHCDIETAAKRNLNRGNNICAHYCEPYHLRWIMEALDTACPPDEKVGE